MMHQWHFSRGTSLFSIDSTKMNIEYEFPREDKPHSHSMDSFHSSSQTSHDVHSIDVLPSQVSIAVLPYSTIIEWRAVGQQQQYDSTDDEHTTHDRTSIDERIVTLFK